MAYDALQPLDNEHVSDLPYWIRQKGEELRTLRIVDAGKLVGYSAGNLTGNIPISNGTMNTNLVAQYLGDSSTTKASFAPVGHVNSRDGHPVATTTLTGFMSNTDKTNVDTMKTWYDGEYTKNYFGTVKIDTTDLVAETRSDTLTITSGSGMTLTPTAGTDSFSIGLTVDGNGKASHSHVLSVAGTTDGFMSATQASNLASAYSHISDTTKHYNFGKIVAAGSTFTADSDQDTFTITTGTGISITSSADDSITISLATTANADTLDTYHAGNASGNVPVSNGTMNTNLVAQYIGDTSTTKAQLALIAGANTFSGNNTFSGTNTFSGQIISTNATPAVFKSTGYKSWIFNSPASNNYIFAPSTAVDGVTLDTANQITFSDSANITAKTFTSSIATGTAPFTVTSTTAVANLNADQLDGNHSTAFVKVDGSQTMTGSLKIADNTGTGIGFNSASPTSLGIFSGTNGNYGRVSTDTTSTYNMYFSATSSNNGFVFKTSTGNVACVDSAGTVHAEAGFRTKKFSIQYNATEDSLDFTVS